MHICKRLSVSGSERHNTAILKFEFMVDLIAAEN